jgi:ABC-type maltose transport system permease subunit
MGIRFIGVAWKPFDAFPTLISIPLYILLMKYQNMIYKIA